MFSAFTPLAGGNLSDFLHPNESPFNLDASLQFVRPVGANGPWPSPDIIGHVSGIAPLMDQMAYAINSGKMPFGPWAGSALPDLNVVFPNFQGGLSKVVG